MKTLILYSSKTGYSKQYADWLSNSLKAPAISLREFDSDLDQYDLVIYGGGLYAGGIHGKSRFEDLLPNNKAIEVIYFFTGASSPNSLGLEKILLHNFKTERPLYKTFYLRGGFHYQALNPLDKVLMQAKRMTIRLKALKHDLTPDDIGLLKAFNKPVNFTKEEDLYPLIKYIASLEA